MRTAAAGSSSVSRVGSLAAGLAPVLAALAATAVVFRLVWPVHTGPVGFDSAASVIFFDRIAAGQQLESAVTTTPKPLLTMVYGLTHAIVPDWRAINVLVIAVFGLGVLLAGMLVRRLVPRCPALVRSLIAALVLTGSVLLVEDVAIAYAVAWALVGWLLAGLGATARPIRPWLVGLGLLVATLARLETVVVTGVIALAAAWSLIAGRRGRPLTTWTPRRLLATVAIASLALPVMLLHDWRLTGDPFFWARVSSAYSAASSSIPSAREVLGEILAVALKRPLLTVAAVIGIWHLWQARQREAAVGLLALWPGLGLFLVLLAVRGIYVSPRYYAAIEVALLLAAIVGLAALCGLLLDRLAPRLPARGYALPALAAALGLGAAAVVIVSPFAPLRHDVREYMTVVRADALTADRSVPAVLPILAPGHARAGAPKPDPLVVIVTVPGLLRPRMAVDLDVPLWGIRGNGPATVAADGSGVSPGEVIVHSKRLDRPPETFAVLAGTSETALGPHTLVPVVRLAGGIVVLQVR